MIAQVFVDALVDVALAVMVTFITGIFGYYVAKIVGSFFDRFGS